MKLNTVKNHLRLTTALVTLMGTVNIQGAWGSGPDENSISIGNSRAVAGASGEQLGEQVQEFLLKGILGGLFEMNGPTGAGPVSILKIDAYMGEIVGLIERISISTDRDQIVKRLRDLADNFNSMYAQHYLGVFMIEEMYGFTSADLSDGEKYSLKAADQGLDQAQYSIGSYILDQRGSFTKSDIKRGVDYMRSAADQGLDAAMNHLGLLMVTQQFGFQPSDRDRGVQFLREASKTNVKAQWNLGNMMLNRLYGFDGSFRKEGMALLRQASKNGSEEAAIELNKNEKSGQDFLRDRMHRGTHTIEMIRYFADEISFDFLMENFIPPLKISPLMFAAYLGDENLVVALLDAGANIDFCNPDNYSPLSFAMDEGHKKIVALLLHRGAKVNNLTYQPLSKATDPDMQAVLGKGIRARMQVTSKEIFDLLDDAEGKGNAAAGPSTRVSMEQKYGDFWNACFKGKKDDVERMLKDKSPENIIDVNHPRSDGLTALHFAAQKGRAEIVRLLVVNGAQIDKADLKGQTALHRAAEYNQTVVVSALVDLGADIQIKDKEFNQPLTLAIKGSHDEVMEILILAQKKLIPGPISETSSATAVASSSVHAQIINEDIIALNNASQAGRLREVQELMLTGKDIEGVDIDGNFPLLHAIFYGHDNVAEFLINHGASVTKTNLAGTSPIHEAAVKNNVKIIELILRKGGDVNSIIPSEEYQGTTPLLYAAQDGHIETVEFLLKHKANPNLARRGGVTPLLMAAEFNQWKVIPLLIDSGATVDLPNDQGDSPLIIACFMGYRESVTELIRKGANLNATDKLGNSLLVIAALKGHAAVVDLLLTHNRTKEDIETAYIAAEQNQHKAILSILKKHLFLETVRTGTTVDLNNLFSTYGLEPQGKGKEKRETYSIDPVIGREALLLALELDKRELVDLLAKKIHGHLGILSNLHEESPGDPAETKKEKSKKKEKAMAGPMNATRGETLLMLAAERGNINAVHYLRQNENLINIQDENGKTALMRAAQAGQVNIVQELMAGQPDGFGSFLKGANLELLDDNGLTVLHWAIQTGNRQVFDALIKPLSPQTQDKGKKAAKVPIEMLDKNRRTPLMLAMELNNVPMITHLIRLGAQVTAPDGSTVLHLAAQRGWRDVYNHLITTNIDRTITNKDGKTAQDILNDRVWEARVRKADLVLSSDPVDGQTLEEWNEFKDRINCPIGFGIMKDPVFGVYLEDDKLSTHSYGRADLATLLKNGGQDPLTRKVLKPQEIVPNQALKDEITAFLDTHAPLRLGMEWEMPAGAQ